jgi:hypothetical protein
VSSPPRTGITFALYVQQAQRVDARSGHSGPTGRTENDMHHFQIHVFRLAITAMILLLASPLMAQEPSGQPSTRASVLDQAREALTNQSVAPERSTFERGLYWYDNQYVLNKIFCRMEGNPCRRR